MDEWRNRKRKPETKSKYLGLRVTEKQYNAVAKKAEKRGCTISDYILLKVMEG